MNAGGWLAGFFLWAAAGAAAEVLSPFYTFPVVLRHYETPEKHQIETMAGGVAAFDYDQDGWVDVFFTNGAPQPSLRKAAPRDCNRLFRNLGGGKFEEAKTNLCGSGYDQGVAAADYDNDGRIDLFVGGVRSSALWRNAGGGRFERQPLAVSGWSVGGGWFDFDRDGDLDLFVVRYVAWDPAQEPFCGDRVEGYRTYCHPKFYQGLSNQLFRNDGGKFTDVSQASGIAAHVGKGMAVAFGDLDGDGFLDALVTNDTVANFLFRNRGDGTFEEVGESAGIALNDDGRALSSMGAEFRDIDNDGREDLFLTALTNETFPLYKNLGKGLFRDVTYPTRIGKATLAYSGWSCGIFDFDNDGRKDIFTANGDVQTNTEVFSSRSSRQRNLLLLNTASGFVPQAVGEAGIHRGAAFADFDRDGKIDVVVTQLGGAPVLLKNSTPASANNNHWLAVVVRPGTLVRIGGGQVNRSTTAVGYASASPSTVHFGLGPVALVQEVIVTWPGGKQRRLTNVKADQYLTVDEP